MVFALTVHAECTPGRPGCPLAGLPGTPVRVIVVHMTPFAIAGGNRVIGLGPAAAAGARAVKLTRAVTAKGWRQEYAAEAPA